MYAMSELIFFLLFHELTSRYRLKFFHLFVFIKNLNTQFHSSAFSLFSITFSSLLWCPFLVERIKIQILCFFQKKGENLITLSSNWVFDFLFSTRILLLSYKSIVWFIWQEFHLSSSLILCFFFLFFLVEMQNSSHFSWTQTTSMFLHMIDRIDRPEFAAVREGKIEGDAQNSHLKKLESHV